MNANGTRASLPDAVLEKIVRGTAMKFFGARGGDPDELLSAAWCYAGQAIDSFDGRGQLEGWISRSIWWGLLEDQRKFCKFHGRLKQHPLPATDPAAEQGWDGFCRRLMGEVGGDLAVVISTALEAPGEVMDCLAADGWSVPRILAALNEAREELT